MPGLPRDTSKADVEASDIATASTAQQQSISPPEQNTVESNIMDTNGYHKLAHLMTLAPEAALFRRFGFLNTMNLLRLQAELHDMEEKLVDVWKEDYDSGDPIRMAYAGDFRIMRDYVEDGDTTQYDLLNDIGAKLKEYNEALRGSLSVAEAARPSKYDVDFLRRWLSRPSMGNAFLTGAEATIWDGTNDDDLLTLLPRGNEADPFTGFLRERLLSVYHNLVGRHQESHTNIIHERARLYHERSIDATSSAIVAALSAALPTLMVLVLYFVNSMLIRIGLVILFTTIFSVALALFTGAKKIEIFSATAAFAAVEVVFIGSVSASG